MQVVRPFEDQDRGSITGVQKDLCSQKKGIMDGSFLGCSRIDVSEEPEVELGYSYCGKFTS